MGINQSILQYFWLASPIVKIVILILIAASFASWVMIFQRRLYLKATEENFNHFERQFWESPDLHQLYQTIAKQPHLTSIEKIFAAGFKEFSRLQGQFNVTSDVIIANIERAMHVAYMDAQNELETHLSFLATVGSTSPYIGLFGTVWGIMTAFQALGHVEQATIAMVAPGISEALVATALGLFAAIPAVIAYNRYTYRVEKLLLRQEAFQENFINFLSRELQ